MRPTPNTLRTIFIVAITVLFSISLFLFLNINELVKSNKLVSHAWEVKTKVHELHSGLKSAESDIRSYLLTKDRSFLRTRMGYSLALTGRIDKLQELTKDHPRQEAYLPELELLITKRLDLMDATIAHSRRSDRFEIDTNLLYQGTATMNQIGIVIDKIIETENDLLTERQLVQSRYEASVPNFAFMLNVFLLGLLGFMLYRLQKQITALQQFHDQLQHSNKELAQQQQELKARNEELESFNYIASHDLKEPLRKINMFSGMIYEKDYAVLSETGKLNFGRIQSAVNRMQALLDDLLAYTRIKTEDVPLEYVDINSIVETVKENLKEQITESGAVIETQNLPEVRGIAFQLTQLMDNLLSNAIKYSKPGVPPKVNLSSKLVSREELPTSLNPLHPLYHCVEVKDNGVGFDQHYAHKIFDLFSRLHHEVKQPGTGVGLTICKKIVANHDGFITVNSTKGEGTSFFIYLPE